MEEILRVLKLIAATKFLFMEITNKPNYYNFFKNLFFEFLIILVKTYVLIIFSKRPFLVKFEGGEDQKKKKS